ncbi:HNH endonuclease signature motif containing protein [Agrococcus beijingensis]|uniref:HNH endonuclease signature motif containing protein n=1 Tax=Agrococcus beijingensis TaxID=3068634 RepID=UPI0027421255|nr:HNH endonuclease signature motif containing protein [Agrococcus sp. REN33]
MAIETGTTADAVAALEAALAAAADAAAVLDALLPRLDTQQRWEVVGLVGDLGRATDSLKLRIADDVVHRHDDLPKDERFTVGCGYRDVADMLASEFGASRYVVKRLLAATKHLKPWVTITGDTVPARFPLLGAAIDRGAISIDQAVTVIDALGDAPNRAHPDDLAAAEAALVDHATGVRGAHPADSEVLERPMPPEMLAKVARGWRDALDPDGVEPTYEQQLRQRDFRFGTRADGMFAGAFVLTPDQGPTFAAAFDAFTRPKSPRFKDDAELDTALVDGDDRTRGQRMADALVAMVASSVEGREVPRVGGEAPTVVIHVQKSAIDAAAEGVPGCTATVERTGETVPVHVASAIMCDGYIQSVTIGADGEPLYLGRRKRFFNRAQRRALAARDGGCRAPGCDFPVGWTDAHHIQPWSEGGPTDLSNGILLCKHHHQEVHRGALEIVWGEHGWVVQPTMRAPYRRRGWTVIADPERLYPKRAA